jgi:hypothetical protein
MNYFNYFTEIETRFQQRRGSLLMLSTLDWALIETWREAGIPVEAVLRGIDDAFDKYDAKTQRAGKRVRKVNGLAWCAQAVMQAVEQSREAAIGAHPAAASDPPETGFETARICRYLDRNAALLEAANLPAATETAARLRALSHQLGWPILSQGERVGYRAELDRTSPTPETLSLEDLDRTLTILEEKLFAALLITAPEDQLVALRAQADRELAPYRGKMQAVQIKQVQQQFLHKRLLEAHALPRLSLFYMPHD